MSSTYQELTITTDEKFIELISDFVASMYDDAIEITNNAVIVRSPNDLGYIQNALQSLRKSIGGDFTLTCHRETKYDDDWIKSYQNSVKPVDSGVFYVRPSWEKPKDGKIDIIIDPALAFGSGHHATTFGCLGAIEMYVKSGDTVLDIGCGSGILGLAARKLGGTVDLCDTDPVSVESTRENFSLNNEVFRDIWEGSVNKTEQKYDIVIANIVADILKAIKIPLTKSIKTDGTLILSGILDTKESVVTQCYDEFELIQRNQIDEWITLVYKT